MFGKKRNQIQWLLAMFFCFPLDYVLQLSWDSCIILTHEPFFQLLLQENVRNICDVCKIIFSFLYKATSTNKNSTFLFINYFSGGNRRSRKCHNSGLSRNSGKTSKWKPLTPNVTFLPEDNFSTPYNIWHDWIFFFLCVRKIKTEATKITKVITQS